LLNSFQKYAKFIYKGAVNSSNIGQKIKHGGKENKMKAYILLSTKPGTSLEVVQRIKEKVKEAIIADAIFGRYDAIIILEAPALENINQVVYKIIEKDPNVIRTETSIVLSPMK
jgi:DNA-binding Lrp family transcriptional regulator